MSVLLRVIKVDWSLLKTRVSSTCKGTHLEWFVLAICAAMIVLLVQDVLVLNWGRSVYLDLSCEMHRFLFVLGNEVLVNSLGLHNWSLFRLTHHHNTCACHILISTRNMCLAWMDGQVNSISFAGKLICWSLLLLFLMLSGHWAQLHWRNQVLLIHLLLRIEIGRTPIFAQILWIDRAVILAWLRRSLIFIIVLALFGLIRGV